MCVLPSFPSYQNNNEISFVAPSAKVKSSFSSATHRLCYYRVPCIPHQSGAMQCRHHYQQQHGRLLHEPFLCLLMMLLCNSLSCCNKSESER